MQNLFNTAYKDKKVFLTGHTGFKGSWLTLWLYNLGSKVIGYSLPPPTNPSFFEISGLSEKIINNYGNILDYSNLLQVMRAHNPEIVIHNAAQSLVRDSYENPLETFDTNLMGTAKVLEAVRHTPSVRVCIIVTSDKCYENKEREYSYQESDSMGGYDPYSASKGCAELVTSSYARSFFNPDKYNDHKKSIASVRAGNVIGGGDWATDRLIPDCIRSLSKNESVLIRNPSAIRPWQHVLEPLSGYLWLGAQLLQHPLKYQSGWNFGPNMSEQFSVEEIVKNLIDTWGAGKWEVEKSKPQAASKHEANFLKLDCTRAANLLNWRPVFSLKKSIQMTADWYKNFYENTKFDSTQFSVSQINEYVDAAKSNRLPWAIGKR